MEKRSCASQQFGQEKSQQLGVRAPATDATRRYSMLAFGAPYSDNEIAAVANYVTGRFGGGQDHRQDVADLRGETVR